MSKNGMLPGQTPYTAEEQACLDGLIHAASVADERIPEHELEAHAKAAALFDHALVKIESHSIRNWAAQNRAEWLKIIASGGAVLLDRRIAQAPADEQVSLYAAYIVATAIGA